MALVLILVCFFALAQASLFGESVDVTANVWVNATYYANSLSLLVPFKVDIKASKATTCIFKSYTSVNTTIWGNLNSGGYQALATGSLTITGAASSGYELTCADATATVEAYITFAALDTSVQALLGVGYDAGLLQFNSQTGGTVRIQNAAWYNADYTLKVHFPSVGIFLLASIKQTVSVSATAGGSGSIWAPAQSGQTYSWSLGATNDLKITFDCQESNTLTVQPLAQTSYNITTEKLKELKVWFNVNLQNAAAAHTSTIKYTYTDAQLTAVGLAVSDANKLRLARYDTTTMKWQTMQSGGSVDLQAKVVSQTTTQFSQWGLYMGGENSSSSLRVQALSVVALFATVVALLL
jgi:hypothetical protein